MDSGFKKMSKPPPQQAMATNACGVSEVVVNADDVVSSTLAGTVLQSVTLVPNTNKLKQVVAKLDPTFLKLKKYFRERVRVEVKGGQCDLDVFFADSLSEDDSRDVIFYIPGTAFVSHNYDISSAVASHLAHAQNAEVVLLSHRLTPGNQWPTPIDDVIAGIKFYSDRRALKKVSLAGYSSGGLLAVLALMYFKNNPDIGLAVKNLFLFSPMLSFSMGFRELIKSHGLSKVVELPQTELASNMQAFQGQVNFLRDEKLVREDNKDIFTKAEITSSQDKILDKGYMHNINYNCFSSEDQSVKKRQEHSPLWRSPNLYSGLETKISIITGVNDYLIMDSLFFLEILKKAGLKPSYIELAGRDHSFLWKSLSQIYLTRFITEKEQVIHIPAKLVSKLEALDGAFKARLSKDEGVMTAEVITALASAKSSEAVRAILAKSRKAAKAVPDRASLSEEIRAAKKLFLKVYQLGENDSVVNSLVAALAEIEEPSIAARTTAGAAAFLGALGVFPVESVGEDSSATSVREYKA